ncbi:hypothetical protein K443DRAFT_547590 [Laccaria amethystina LaAM-08-1]|uniref:Unplaced genomic scaffold K443scaffold_66, whole genome shotgun sequence n=1 Tax=Laccaria amethystina LaAM-08-1 TaxID=1095629 RepID=A0A0C9XVZ2_9AGAR|nr:hypothetical protein K443DRAFT_547590 [Laccaria amethystina LaAM-08-1]
MNLSNTSSIVDTRELRCSIHSIVVIRISELHHGTKGSSALSSRIHKGNVCGRKLETTGTALYRLEQLALKLLVLY